MTLQEWRKHVNVSQEELGVVLGFSQQLISAWESGRKVPARRHWPKLEEITKQPIFRLFPNILKGSEGMGHTHGR